MDSMISEHGDIDCSGHGDVLTLLPASDVVWTPCWLPVLHIVGVVKGGWGSGCSSFLPEAGFYTSFLTDCDSG